MPCTSKDSPWVGPPHATTRPACQQHERGRRDDGHDEAIGVPFSKSLRHSVGTARESHSFLSPCPAPGFHASSWFPPKFPPG